MVKSSTRNALDALLARSPALPAFRLASKGRLAVLAYHGVEDPDSFDGHLREIVRSMRPVTVEEVASAVRQSRSLPPRSVLVTFDDGHRSVMEQGLPLMREYGIPGVVFVVAGLLDSDEPYWWSSVRELVLAGGRAEGFPDHLGPEEIVRRLKQVDDERRIRAIDELKSTATVPAARHPQLRSEDLIGLESAGIAVGNHSLSHPCLVRCAPEKIRYEVAAAHENLVRALGHVPLAFAYPDGGCNGIARQAVEDAGYDLAFLFDHRLSGFPPEDPLRISRLRVDSDTRRDRFLAIVSGLHPALHRMRGIP